MVKLPEKNTGSMSSISFLILAKTLLTPSFITVLTLLLNCKFLCISLVPHFVGGVVSLRLSFVETGHTHTNESYIFSLYVTLKTML